MKNIKSVVLTLLVMFAISALVAGCSKKDAQTENRDMNNMNNSNNMSNSNNMNNSNKSDGMEMIKVSSMQCGTCKKNIETAVSKVEGVSEVNVDKNKKIAHVEFDKSKTNLSKIEDAITAAGYDANDKKKDMKAYENLDDCCKLPKDQKEPGQH
ncbi:MAG: heavy-metal-associated domain-containing protein [Ignavibacteria bacterium]|nr:heavy-metal-associated domain-containing protein [Ignavibacteria bacterium]